MEFTPLTCTSAIDLSDVPENNGRIIRKWRREELTHGFRIFDTDRSISETVDNVDDDPLSVCHDGDDLDAGNW